MHDVELFLHAGFQARLKTDFQKAYIQQKQTNKNNMNKSCSESFQNLTGKESC